jgi:hypothetical protein
LTVFVQFIDRRHKVLLTQLSGTFGKKDVAALYAAAERLYALEGKSLRSLQDFTDVKAVDIQVGQIAQHGWRPQVVPGRQRMMVVPQPEFQPIAHMFAAYQKIADNEAPHIVRSLDEAYALLDLKNPQFEPIG